MLSNPGVNVLVGAAVLMLMGYICYYEGSHLCFTVGGFEEPNIWIFIDILMVEMETANVGLKGPECIAATQHRVMPVSELRDGDTVALTVV